MYGYGYSAYNRLAFLGGFDSNASAFFVATGITDPTIQGAIDTLCKDLKKYGVFDKMKAIYPFVGGTATTHKFNLVNPADTDAAFRLAFNGGWTHSSNGATPNGTNGYANTFLTQVNAGMFNNTNLSYYSRTNNVSAALRVEMGIGYPGTNTYGDLLLRLDNTNVAGGTMGSRSASSTSTDSTGYMIVSSTPSATKSYKNNVIIATNSSTQTGVPGAYNIYIGSQGSGTTAQQFTDRQCAFSTIGDGLTDEEVANLYYSVQKFQTTLGRQVGTPIYSSNATDVNARLFLGATNIQDATITSAVDTLVQGLKTDGIWTKLKAVYPFVGGTATTHKFNLANALDEDTSFRLAFSGGITHNANGMQGNGVNGFANTFLIPSSNLTQDSTHMSFYSRSNIIDAQIDMGTTIIADSRRLSMQLSYSGNFAADHYNFSTGRVTIANSNTSGYFLSSRINSTTHKAFKNSTQLGTTNTGASGLVSALTNPMYVAAANQGGTAVAYSSKHCCFASIGSGLTDTEAANLYTRVQAFQTTLNRQV